MNPGAGQWFLSAAERRNDHTALDRRHSNGLAWTEGNEVVPLVHGATYFRQLLTAVEALGPGDLLLFTDWRGDPDERLAGAGTEVGKVFAGAARRGADVRGLIWRSHLDRFQFSAAENRHLGQEIEDAGGQCLLDMRVRTMGSHHQKLVVIRHRDRPERDVAFVGGIDLCHSRNDDAQHHGDPQRQPMAAVYGMRPPWHDVQVALRGPAVGDAEAVFRERWEDPAPLSRNPIHLVGERVRGEDRTARPLPPQRPDPEPCGNQAVQLLRTYPRRLFGYPFAPDGETSVASAYRKVLERATSLVYVEDQYLWSSVVADVFAQALEREPQLRIIAVIPRWPDQDGRASMPPNLLGREPVLRRLHAAGPGRVAVYSPENHAGTPVYVHAKVCVVDDRWACVGSDNANRRSWTHDSELSCAVLDQGVVEGAEAGASWARTLRLQLAQEHLDLDPDKDEDAVLQTLADPIVTFDAFTASATALDNWHAAGRSGPRPPGRLRPYFQQPLSPVTKLWANPLYRLLYDPVVRPRRRGTRG